MLPKSVLLALTISALSVLAHGHGHHEHAARRLPKQRNTREEALRKMFKRQGAATYPPLDVFGPTPLPAWVDTYNNAVAQGLIPDIAPSVDNDGWPAYPASVDISSTEVCSWTMAKCNGTGDLTDIVDAPDGMIGISFDDGPQPASTELLGFVTENNIPTTHFVIGSRIAAYPDLFTQMLDMNGQIAVHTWAHPLMSSMTDMQVLGELGWTMQAIYDNSNGLVPAFWRPPYGDVDNRIRAIATYVFGMQCVLWNQDTDDWCLSDDGTNSCGVNRGPQDDAGLDAWLSGWIHGPKSPGLIILEHEHRPRAVAGFMRAWPQIVAEGWTASNIPDMFGLPWYLNSLNSNSGDIDTSVTIGSGNFTVDDTTTSSANIESTRDAMVQPTNASPTANASPPNVDADDASTQSDETGWHALESTAQYGIIGGAAGGAALLLGLLGFCLWRKKKSKATGPVALPLSASQSSRTDESKHPYQAMNNTESSWSLQEKGSPDLNYYPSPPMSPADFGPPLPPSPLASSMPIMQRRLSGQSDYSQGEEDSFAKPEPARLASPSPGHLSPTPQQQQRSTFHLPNRVASSPYRDESRPSTPDWI